METKVERFTEEEIQERMDYIQKHALLLRGQQVACSHLSSPTLVRLSEMEAVLLRKGSLKDNPKFWQMDQRLQADKKAQQQDQLTELLKKEDYNGYIHIVAGILQGFNTDLSYRLSPHPFIEESLRLILSLELQDPELLNQQFILNAQLIGAVYEQNKDYIHSHRTL